MPHRYSVPVALILALAAGTFAGYVDLHNDEVQAAVLVIVVSGFLLGAATPRQALAIAAIIGLCIPAAHVYARARHLVLPYEMTSWGWSFLALIPALIATGSGAGARWLLSGHKPVIH
jgi:hypothetical protein